MQALTWLHLSDIHFDSKKPWSDSYARVQLLAYLTQCFQKEPQLRPDLIFCTGDIAFGELPGEPLVAQYAQAAEFFEQLLLVCGVAKDRLFVVPGNHDVNRRAIDGDAQSALNAKADDSERHEAEINRRIHNRSFEFQNAMHRLAAYVDFTQRFLPHQYDSDGRATYAKVVQVAGATIGICGLNSAWACDGGAEGRLWLGAEWQFNRAKLELQNTTLRIALMHHPVDWLNQSERDYSAIRMANDFHFFLHGHSQPQNALVEPGKCTTITAGIMAAEIPYAFGVNLVRLDLATGKGQVYLHRYDKFGWAIAPVSKNAPSGVWDIEFSVEQQSAKLDDGAVLVRKAGAASDRDASLLDKSIAIQSLELKDIRGFTDLKLELSTPSGNDGQWIVFLGQNGVGKTTLLRSLALALRNLDDRPIWPDAFSGWPRTIDRDGTLARHAFIKTVLADGSVHQTNITSNGSTKFSQTPEQNQPSQCLLFAYGCRRGSTTGGPKREFSFDKEGGPEIATLFEEFAGMVHAETWLKDLSSKPALLRAVLDAIKTFLDVDAVELRDNNLLITEHDKPPLALKQLSDGYLTSAGWFIDLLARWIDYAERQGKIIEPGFMQQMRGLVLIDEIDMHLHPRWQIEIIRRTRTLMPQMSFIVTTHNPLTLVGAKAEEIWMLENDGGNIVATRGVEAPLLLTGGQIYMRYFGIRDIYPDGLGSDMQRYNFLSRYALRNDAEDNELQELHQRLAQAGILPEWPIVPREGASDKPVKASPKPRRRAEAKK